jgi:hypothetical protein
MSMYIPWDRADHRIIIERVRDSYNRILPEHQDIILRHLRLSGELQMWEYCRVHLRYELIVKKGVPKPKPRSRERTLPDPLSKAYHDTWVGWGKRGLIMHLELMDFRHCLYRLMRDELGVSEDMYDGNNGSYNLWDVYGGHPKHPQNLRFDQFNPNDWQLNSGHTMTSHDIEIMERFKQGIQPFIERCLELLRRYDNRENTYMRNEYRKCLKWHKRITNSMNPVLLNPIIITLPRNSDVQEPSET